MKPQHEPDDEQGRRQEREQEIEHVRELLDRTVRFLTRCSQDPKAALQVDDPQDLIRGLQALGVGPTPLEAPRLRRADEPAPGNGPERESSDAPHPFPLPRRRSA